MTPEQINADLVEDLNKDFLTTEANGYSSLVNYSSLYNEPVHRWFRYREGYSTELVKKLINGLPKGSVILDPFCGCGTTLISAQSLGYESVGFDINPLSVFVSRVKTREYTETDIQEFRNFLNSVSSISFSSPSDDPPVLSIIDKVFHPEVLGALLRIRRLIKTVEKEQIRSFLMLAWLSILERVSNVFKEGNGIKYRNRRRTPTGYITISDEEWQTDLFPKNKFEYVKDRFVAQLNLMIEDLRQRGTHLPRVRIFEQSADTVTDQLHENSIAYILFSPPYCNCFNYFKIFKIELWMGEFVKSYKELRSLNGRAMRSHVETTMDRDYDHQIPFVEEFVNLICTDGLWDRRIPKAIKGYFIDMQKIMSSLYKVLKPGGNCVSVVGNSAYAGILIPTDLLLSKISSNIGFKIEKLSVARHLTTSSQQKLKLTDRRKYLRESLVFMNKPDERLTEKRIKYVNELPKEIDIKEEEEVYVLRNNGLSNLTHKFHRFPAKFIPHVPRWAINRYLDPNKSSYVLDPFCGSGTTLVESMLSGHDSFGIDIDPIAKLVSRVKTTPLNKATLEKLVKDFKTRLSSTTNTTFLPITPNINHWFSEQAIRDLSAIRETIEQYKHETEIYDFLLVCFIAIIRRSSNADNQTQKTYVSHTHLKTPEPARPLFEEVLEDYSKRLGEFSQCLVNGTKSSILPYSDARNFTDTWYSDGLPLIDLVISSPPYVKSVDYVYNQMAEYFWVGDLFDLNNQIKLNDFKKRYIGTTKISKDEYIQEKATGINSVDGLYNRIFEKNAKHAYIVYKYFADILAHFSEIKRILSPGAHYVLVVGDSMVSNEPVLVHKLIQDCAQARGFSVENYFSYEIRNRSMRFPRRGRGGVVRYDWIIDLQNGD